jgi:hypothetical protein
MRMHFPHPGAAMLACRYAPRAHACAEMQAESQRWATHRQLVPSQLIGRVAPTRLEGINLRGVFRFPPEGYAQQVWPSTAAAKSSTVG